MPQLIGIATRGASRAPMQPLSACEITLEHGVADDLRGKPGDRQVTVLSGAAWRDACSDLGEELPWTTRRANLLVDDLDLRDSLGARIRIGDALLLVTEETRPCALMEKQRKGLRKALEPEWRGGATCRVLEAGSIRCGDAVSLERD